jgi:hypothetical protein
MSLFFDSVLINTVPLFIGIAKRLWEHTLLQKSVYQILIDAHSQSNHKKSLLISQEAFVDILEKRSKLNGMDKPLRIK